MVWALRLISLMFFSIVIRIWLKFYFAVIYPWLSDHYKILHMHNSTAVVPCAKFCSNQSLGMRMKQNGNLIILLHYNESIVCEMWHQTVISWVNSLRPSDACMNQQFNHHYTLHFNEVERGYTGITLSVCPSVDRIVSALYIQQYLLDPFHICTSYQATSEGVVCNVYFKTKKIEILANSLNL